LTAGWVNADEVASIMVEHIRTEMTRYKSAIYAWEVVNEPLNDHGRWQGSLWYHAMGPNYVALCKLAGNCSGERRA
jgi:endo-1,4-beta-xylanase